MAHCKNLSHVFLGRSKLEAITIRLQAIASRLEAVAIRLEAIAMRFMLPYGTHSMRSLGNRTAFERVVSCLGTVLRHRLNPPSLFEAAEKGVTSPKPQAHIMHLQCTSAARMYITYLPLPWCSSAALVHWPLGEMFDPLH